jgi:hypothetical protein
MIKLKSLLVEGGKSLRVFDFDDTLAKVDSYIYVKTPSGKEKKLDSAEFAVYKPKKGEEFDFRDFIDDSAKNVRAVERRMKKYPHVKLKTIVA